MSLTAFQRFRLSLLFGTLYLVQGLSEPTTGILSQPCVRERRQHRRERQLEVIVTTFPRALRSPSVRAVSAMLFACR